MAKIEHQLYPGIIIDTDSGVRQGGHWKYTATKGGITFALPNLIPFDPAALEEGINNPDSPVYGNLSATLNSLQFASRGSGSTFEETIGPALQKTPANIAGAVLGDLPTLALRLGVEAPINFFDWAFGGFEGKMPSKRYITPEVPILGSESIARGMEWVGDIAREGIRATEEAGLNVTIPEYIPVAGGARVGVRTLLEPFAFRTTIDESTKEREYISLITQIVGAAPFEGAAIAKLALYLAKTTKNVTSKAVYDALSEMQVNRPTAAAAYETIMGAGVGTGMIASVEGLEEAWPNAPPWVKSLVMAGGGILIPIGALTATKTAWDVGLNIWPLKLPLQLLRGITEAVTPSGARKAGARAIQSTGGDWRDRQQILGIFEHLRFALNEGRNIDKATGLAYTLPQMARNEATVLDAQLSAALRSQNPPTAKEVTAAKEKIQKLRIWGNYQEGQLKTLSEDTKIGAQVYVKYSERMLDRRDLIFEALDNAIFQLDQIIGGRSSEGVDPAWIEADYASGAATDSYQYTENIKRAIAEGRGGTLNSEQIAAIRDSSAATTKHLEAATEGALDDALRKAQLWRNNLPEDMSPEQRAFLNEQISRDLETAYQEIDYYEDVFWNSIEGFNRPKTRSHFSPDGEDLGPQILIDGVPVGDHFAAKIANLKGGERENQSKWLWKLAGRQALADQAATGKGPDVEKIARQNLEVKTAEARLAEEQRKLNRATATLAELQEPKPTRVRPGVHNYKGFVIERISGNQWDIKGKGQTAADESATSLKDAVASIDDRFPTQGKLDSANADWEKAGDRVVSAENRLAAARGKLDISLGKGVTDRDVAVNLATEITDKSELGVTMVNDAPTGRSAQEVNNVIGHLKREMTYEQGQGPLKNSAKLRAIGGMIDDLQRAIGDPENFTVNAAALKAARSVTAIKKDSFEKGSVGQARGFTRAGEPRVEPEKILNLIAPGSATAGTQAVALRELQVALTPITVGERTPFRVIGVNEEGRPLVEIDDSFNLSEYAASPPLPFERITRGRRSAGYKVAEGTPVTQENIDIVRQALWDRFKIFGSGKTFDERAAARWINNNEEALGWLKRAAPDEPTGFEELASAERVVKTLQETTKKNIDRTIEKLRNEDAFNDVFTEQGFREILRGAAQRDSNLASAAIFLDAPDPLTLGETFLNNYLKTSNSNPTDFLRQTLRSLENGALDDGTNPALSGFKQAVAEELLKRGLTTKGANTPTAKDADRLSASLGYEVKLWDADALMGMADNPKFQKLLGDLYGGHAPDMFRKIAEGAQKQNYISRAAARGVTVQDKFSGEVAGNIGRMIGGYASRTVIIPVSSLVLTGMGRRYGQAVIENIRGLAAEKQIVDFLMNPRLGIAAATEFPLLSANEDALLQDRFKLWAHYNFIGRNAERLKRMGQAPGILYEIGEPTKYEEILEEGTAPQSWGHGYEGIPEEETAPPPSPEMPPRLPPTLASRTPPAPPRPIVAGSTLAQARLGFNELAARPPQPLAAAASQGPPPPDRTKTLQDMAALGLNLFEGPITANKGGLASLQRKPRQMVH